ncbi:hypothetical protein Cgig2_011154 [Carnegiea gigantea]|uniref:Ubiquitin-like protease family profile domain-containing protein n=1 Tax=Carnegiea gigantea TaxID=171969 RepID=A0A9Q1GJZ3_9CARY|nr:hypothetical protein Cgig2_011154 [Carnegiea gigantea]
MHLKERRDEELYEFNAHDKAHRLWIDKEATASIAVADSHLENSILDVWSIIMNKKQLSRKITRPSRFFFTTYAYVNCYPTCTKTILKYQEFYKVMQLETQRTNWHDFNTVDVVSSSILYDMCSLILMFIKLYRLVHLDYSKCAHLSTCSLYYMTVNIINNLTLPEKPSTKYDDCDILLKCFFTKYPIQCGHPKVEEVKYFQTVYVKTDYQDNINLHDCGIYTMHHMETYYGDLQP